MGWEPGFTVFVAAVESISLLSNPVRVSCGVDTGGATGFLVVVTLGRHCVMKEMMSFQCCVVRWV